MDLERYFVEANRKKRIRGRWRASAWAIAMHALLIAAFVVFGAQSAKHSLASEKPIPLFITRGAAPPPPPPPPPPKSAGAVKATPRVQQQQKPVEIRPQTLIAPREVPQELPEVTPLQTSNELPETSAGVAEDTGVEGGVEGGIAGGTVGGVTGGVVGGEVGGVVGGVVGGQLGGTGTGTEGTGSGGNDAPLAPEAPPPPPPPPPTAPLRVGGDVKAPVVIDRAEPLYNETARKARIAGTVIVEAIISKSGRVEDVKVIKGLPMGLSQEAEEAVKKWRFKPGTLNGQPVATIFNLTVTFKLN